MCAPDSGVFVGLDKLAPLEDDNSELRTPSKSPKRDDHGQGYIRSILDSIFPFFFKANSDIKFPQLRNFDTLKIDQRVVTFHNEGIPLRGTVRYTGEFVEDSSGHVQSVVGLELVGNPQSHGFTFACFFFFYLHPPENIHTPVEGHLKFPEGGVVRTVYVVRGLTAN